MRSGLLSSVRTVTPLWVAEERASSALMFLSDSNQFWVSVPEQTRSGGMEKWQQELGRKDEKLQNTSECTPGPGVDFLGKRSRTIGVLEIHFYHFPLVCLFTCLRAFVSLSISSFNHSLPFYICYSFSLFLYICVRVCVCCHTV